MTLDVQYQTNLPPPFPFQTITNQLKGNIVLGWLLYVIRSFLHVDLRFQYQLINLVWLSIDFFSFNWSQSCPQNNFKKSFSSSYSEKMHWDQGWAEASLSTFSWMYILVCAVVQKYHQMISLKRNFFLMLILQSTCFICITWKHKQSIESPSIWINEIKQKQSKATSYSIWPSVLLFDGARKLCNGIIRGWLYCQ